VELIGRDIMAGFDADGAAAAWGFGHQVAHDGIVYSKKIEI
jgi:hypothetical protein